MNKEQLKTVVITSLDQGHEVVAAIQAEMSKLMNQMKETTGEEYRALVDEHYELRNAKRDVQNQMTKLVRLK